MRLKGQVQLHELAFLVLYGLIAFPLFLGAAPLFDWDEINFAESAREMVESGDYFVVRIDYRPFWEKPPLFFGLQALFMNIFGVNEFSARLPNALFGVITLITLYSFATRHKDNTFGFMVAGIFAGTTLPFFYFKSGIIDPVFNYFILVGLWQLLFAEQERLDRKKVRRFVYAGLFFGLATLTKGPVGLLVPGLTYLIYKALFDGFRIHWKGVGAAALVYLGVVGAWFGSLILFTPEGMETIRKFIDYQLELASTGVASHGQPFYYHAVVFMLLVFPMAAFVIRGMLVRPETAADRDMKRMMLIWFFVVLILFSIVRTKIVHYASMLWISGAFLAAFQLYEIHRRRKHLTFDQVLHYLIGALLFGLGVLAINLVASNPTRIAGLFEGDFAANALRTDVRWTGWEWIWGAILLILSFVALYFLVKRQVMMFLVIQMVSMALFVNGVGKTIIPRVAEYTQQSVVDFCKHREGSHFILMGHKSYIPYFYGKVRPDKKDELSEEEFQFHLLHQEPDAPVYIIMRSEIVSWKIHRFFPQFVRMYEKGGFTFYKRFR